MANKDYYKLLGVSKDASKDEIKKAFKKLAMKYHPDKASDDKKAEHEERFKEINEAVSVLGDDKKRQQYDQFGSTGFQGQAGFEGFDYSDIMSQFRSGTFGDFDDLFEQVFGGGGKRSGARRGADLAYETEITLEEAYRGTEKVIQLNKLERCTHCSGKGATRFDDCNQCHGTGYLRRTQRTPFGIFQQSGPCGNCRGAGEVPKNSCSHCSGEGAIRIKKKLEISIPAGVEENMRLRISGEGQIGDDGGPNGDLYVIIHIKRHPYFERQENDIHIEVPISFTQAVLGDEIEVPTLDGKATLTIPAGTNTETIFRMREKGIPSVHNHKRGDQMVKVHLEVPQKLSKKQLELIKQLHEEKPSQSFLKRVFG